MSEEIVAAEPGRDACDEKGPEMKLAAARMGVQVR